ncbi:hypothetical protein pdam_00025173, partial [Pocillopora damicornis]
MQTADCRPDIKYRLQTAEWRWVWTYRKDRFNVKVNTTNGVERKNRTYKHQFLADNRDKTLSGVITVLVTQFLPNEYR